MPSYATVMVRHLTALALAFRFSLHIQLLLNDLPRPLQGSWPSVLPLIGRLFKQLGPEGAHLTAGLLNRLGEMLSGASEGIEVCVPSPF